MTTTEVSSIIRNLARTGVDERTIAAAAGVTVSEIRSITATTTSLSPEDEQLANAMRVLAWTAFEEAMQTLIYGAPSDRQALIRAIIGRAMGLVGVQTETQTQELREEMSRIMEEVRGSEEVLIPVDEYEPEAGTTFIDTDDPDERPDD